MSDAIIEHWKIRTPPFIEWRQVKFLKVDAADPPLRCNGLLRLLQRTLRGFLNGGVWKNRSQSLDSLGRQPRIVQFYKRNISQACKF
jgi:hypothetical protein